MPQAGAEAPASVPTTAAAQNQSPTAPLIPANTSPLAGANFLAQLIGQDASPQAQTVLVEYEKLVYLSTIKYKPSDAMRPQVQPSDVFSKMVSERKNQLSSPAAIISFLAEGDGETVSAAVQASPSVARALRPQPREEQVRQAEEEALAAILDNMPVPAQHFPAQALSAYLNSAGRINSAATSGNDVETA